MIGVGFLAERAAQKCNVLGLCDHSESERKRREEGGVVHLNGKTVNRTWNLKDIPQSRPVMHFRICYHIACGQWPTWYSICTLMDT